MWYKEIENGYISAIGEGRNDVQITEEEYEAILGMIRSAPTPPAGYGYALRADTLEWELVELPPAPPESEELTAEEALDILLGGEVE